MAKLLTIDPRFQVPDSILPSDPQHPNNLVRAARELKAQSAADAKYDIVSEVSKEGFRSPVQGPGDLVLLLGILAFVAALWLSMRPTVRPLYSLILLLAFGIFFLIHKKAFEP